MKIGYERSDYPEIRNIIQKVDNYEYINIKKNNLYRYILFIKSKFGFIFNKISNVNLYYTYKSIRKNSVDIIHTFNSVVTSNEKFIVTYETICPRYAEFLIPLEKKKNSMYSKRALRALEALRSDRCKGIIAISECAKNIQCEIISNYKYKEDIIKKITVIHPPQEIYCKDIEEKRYDDEIRFIFVGRDFFGKGGEQIINVFEKLRKENLNIKIKLIVVSSFSNTNVNRPTLEKEMKYKKIVQEADYIEYYSEIDNDKVLEMIMGCHIGLLPTWADTYGYSVLEFQACGCPVISTDVRALSEINNNEVGWLIKVDKNAFGEAYFETNRQKELLVNTIENKMYNIIKDISNDINSIKIKGIYSIERIKKEHNPEVYAKKLYEIYGGK